MVDSTPMGTRLSPLDVAASSLRPRPRVHEWPATGASLDENPLFALLRPFIELCLFRIGPQHLPASTVLLGLALVAHTLTGILGSLMLLPGATALFAGLTGTVLLAAFTTVLLYLQRVPARITQTLTALAGAVTVVDVLGLPVLGWLESAQAAGGDQSLPALLLILLTGWSLTVQGHILRHALSASFWLGLGLALLFSFITWKVMRSLFLGD